MDLSDTCFSKSCVVFKNSLVHIECFDRSMLADNAKPLPSILLSTMQIIHRFTKNFKEKRSQEQSHSVLRNYRVSRLFSGSGPVRNADRKCKAFSLESKIRFPRVGNQIWVCTPQNRTYRAWGVQNWTKKPRAEWF